MKRDEVLSILENADLDNNAKLQQILDMNGASINAQKARLTDLEKQVATHQADLLAERDKYKDYDAIVQERDALKAEKEERASTDRFNAVLGDNKPKNNFTRKGLADLFRAELAKTENAEKQDAEIFAAMVKGHEAEFFETRHHFSTVPSNPSVGTPNDTEGYLDALYKNNPYYKKNN